MRRFICFVLLINSFTIFQFKKETQAGGNKNSSHIDHNEDKSDRSHNTRKRQHVKDAEVSIDSKSSTSLPVQIKSHLIIDTHLFPWANFGRLFIFYDTEINTRCYLGSGILIAPTYVLTAAHNVTPKNYVDVTGIFFIPGLKQGNLWDINKLLSKKSRKSEILKHCIVSDECPFGGSNVVEFRYHPSYIPSQPDKKFDLALLRLQKKFERAEFHQFSVVPDDRWDTLLINLTGYPGRYNGELSIPRMMNRNVKITGHSTQCIYYDAETVTTEGDSGGGIWTVFPTNNSVTIGIHTHAYSNEEGSHSGLLITNDMLLFINSIVKSL